MPPTFKKNLHVGDRSANSSTSLAPKKKIYSLFCVEQSHVQHHYHLPIFLIYKSSYLRDRNKYIHTYTHITNKKGGVYFKKEMRFGNKKSGGDT